MGKKLAPKVLLICGSSAYPCKCMMWVHNLWVHDAFTTLLDAHMSFWQQMCRRYRLTRPEIQAYKAGDTGFQGQRFRFSRLGLSCTYAYGYTREKTSTFNGHSCQMCDKVWRHFSYIHQELVNLYMHHNGHIIAITYRLLAPLLPRRFPPISTSPRPCSTQCQ